MTERADFVAGLFTGIPQHDHFCRLKSLFPTARMSASPRPRPFPRGPSIALPATYRIDGATKGVEDFLAETDTAALLVIKDGAIGFERYTLTGGPATHWMSMSVAKSFVSALVGIAVGDGFIRGVEAPITDYVPELKGSAYDGVSIKDVLQMSSGARWNEDYSDPDSDLVRSGAVLANGGSFNSVAIGMKRQREPGSFNLYNSFDTQALGMLLVKATGRSIADYMQEKLWHPLGMEEDGHWIVDDEQMEMAYGGLQATAHDFAKIGELFRLNGLWHGRQIVPADWVKASLTADAPHLVPGERDNSDSALGYGYQWWLLDGGQGEFSAIGVYNQFVYVNPARGLVIAKLSANRRYGLTNDETSYREHETFEMFRAIGATLV
jgi:CubicO group peptidase (beta-lactamase class C family)